VHKETVTRLQGGNPCVMIEVEGGALLGYNRAQLLENIAIFSSIAEAANAVSIPYEHALELVELMNSHSCFPLVEKLNAGSNIGEAKLTPQGRIALRSFWALYKNFKLSLCAQISGQAQRKHAAACAHRRLKSEAV